MWKTFLSTSDFLTFLLSMSSLVAPCKLKFIPVYKWLSYFLTFYAVVMGSRQGYNNWPPPPKRESRSLKQGRNEPSKLAHVVLHPLQYEVTLESYAAKLLAEPKITMDDERWPNRNIRASCHQEPHRDVLRERELNKYHWHTPLWVLHHSLHDSLQTYSYGLLFPLTPKHYKLGNRHPRGMDEYDDILHGGLQSYDHLRLLCHFHYNRRRCTLVLR